MTTEFTKFEVEFSLFSTYFWG